FLGLKNVWLGHVDQYELMDGSHRPIFLSFLSMAGRPFDFSPFVFRLFSFLLHALNGLFLFLISKRFFNLSENQALAIGIFFIVHPIQITSFDLVWKQSDLWITLFLLSSIWFAEESPISMLLFLVLGLGFKENSLIYPLVWLAFEPILNK